MSSLREKILSTASNLFQTQGINSTGVDTIVAAAGTTKMTMYKYFNSKELLILEVLTESHQNFQNWLFCHLHCLLYKTVSFKDKNLIFGT